MNAERKDPLVKRLEPWFFISPSLLLLLAVGLYPTIFVLYYSFQNWTMGMGPPVFAGLDNYINALTSSDFLGSLQTSGLFLLITLPVELVLGMAIALALDQTRNRTLRRLVQVLLVVPIATTPSVVGMLVQLMFNTQLGIVNYFGHGVGLNQIDWLGGASAAFGMITATQIWEWTPFVALVLSASLATVPGEIEEVLTLDTESFWARFRYIKLPYMRPGIVASLVFQTIFTIKTFDMIYSIEKGGPGNATETVSLNIERVAFRGFDVGLASAESVLTLVVTILLAQAVVSFLYPDRKGAGG
ncbi:MAG TPA: sugar ABC transporter permease [Acetobacteraceae bacterium]|nr:sugar ABC transporter permease [Acetobacteraceae bacterium]